MQQASMARADADPGWGTGGTVGDIGLLLNVTARPDNKKGPDNKKDSGSGSKVKRSKSRGKSKRSRSRSKGKITSKSRCSGSDREGDDNDGKES